jgi:hypothetical protein
MARDNRQFAKFNKIGLGQRDEPLAEGLHLVWASGARVARLTSPLSGVALGGQEAPGSG